MANHERIGAVAIEGGRCCTTSEETILSQIGMEFKQLFDAVASETFYGGQIVKTVQVPVTWTFADEVRNATQENRNRLVEMLVENAMDSVLDQLDSDGKVTFAAGPVVKLPTMNAYVIMVYGMEVVDGN
jgi:hypothetical protein